MQVEKIEKGSKITIQYCKSCDTHSWCTHHNESKYKQTYLQLADSLKKQFKDLIVVGNQVPEHLVPIKARENKYYDSKDNKYVLFPAIGAFEVCWNGQLIFSKKNTNTWPLNSQIISQIYYKINGVPRKSETCQSVNSTQKYGISQKQQRQTVKLANHILENIDKNTTFYKQKAKKEMTLTDHFKRYKMKKKSEQDLQSLYAESESPKHHSKISKITPEDIEKLHQLWGKKENLPNFIKNKALIEEKEGGKKQMLVNLSSIEEQNEMKQIRVDVPKKNKKNKISNLEIQFEKLQKKFLKFQCRVSEVNNKNFDMTGSQVNRQRQKNHGQYSFVDKIQQIKTAYNPQKLVRLIKDKKKRKIEQYIHATLEEKNEKLEQIYGPQYLKPNLAASKVQPHNSKVEKKKKKMSGKQKRSLSKSNQTNNSRFSHQSSNRTEQIEQISEDSCSDILGQPVKRQTNTSYGRKTDNQFSSTSAGFKTQTKQTPSFEKQNINNTKKSVQGISFLNAFEKQRRQFHSRSLLHKPIQQKINEKRKLDARKSQQNQESVPNKNNQRRAEKTQKSSESRRQQASSLEKKKKATKTLQNTNPNKPSQNEQAKMLKKYRVNKKNDADNSRADNVNEDEQRSERSYKMNKSKSSSNKSNSLRSQSRSSMHKNKSSSRLKNKDGKQENQSNRTKKSNKKQKKKKQSEQSPKTSKFKQNKKNDEKQNNLLITYDDGLSDSKQIQQSQQNNLFQSKMSHNRPELHQSSRIKKKTGENNKQSRVKKNSENQSRSNRDDQKMNSTITNRNSANSNKSVKKRMKSQASNDSSIGGKKLIKNSLNSSRSVNAQRQRSTKKQTRNKDLEEQKRQKNKSRFSGDDEQEKSDDNQNREQDSQSQIKQMKKSKSKSLSKMKKSTISNNSKRDEKHKMNKSMNKENKQPDENDETINKSDEQSQQQNRSERSQQEENKKQGKQAKKVEHKQVNNVGTESKPKKIFEIDEEQPEMVDVGVQKNCKFGQEREVQTFGLTDRNPDKFTDNEQDNQNKREKEFDNIRQNEQVSHNELDGQQVDQNNKQEDDLASNEPITHQQLEHECQQTDKSKCFSKNGSDLQKSKISKQKASPQNKSRVLSRKQAPYQHAAITKQLFSSHYLQYIDRLQIPKSEVYKKPKRQQILFSKQSIAPESLKDNTGKLANILKIISIICDKNQYLIVRLFQNALAKDASIFGIWLCQHYSWKCFWVNKSDLDSQQSITHQDGQLWASALVQALILMFDGLQKLAQVSLPELFHALTGSSFLNFKVKQDPQKNNKLLKFISQNEKKNFILVAQKRLPHQLKSTNQAHPYLQTYFILSQKNANNEILLRMKKAKSQAFWIKLQKFVTQFSQVDILQLRVAHNFGQVDIGCNGTDNYIIVEMEFKEQCFGCVVGVAGAQVGDFKMCLYREEQDSVLRLVGQLSDKNKKSSFFDCCFEEGRYYVFTKINSSQSNRVCYLGQGTPKMTIKQQIQEQSLKSSYTQYIPLSNMPAKRPSQQQIEMPKFLNMTRKSQKDSFFNIESGLSNEKNQYKQSRAGKENVMNKEQIKAQFVKYLVNN